MRYSTRDSLLNAFLLYRHCVNDQLDCGSLARTGKVSKQAEYSLVKVSRKGVTDVFQKEYEISFYPVLELTCQVDVLRLKTSQKDTVKWCHAPAKAADVHPLIFSKSGQY